MSKPKIIVLKESLVESIISDVVTIGLLLLCIWLSKGDTWWTFFTAVLLILFISAQFDPFRQSSNRMEFHSLEQLKEWVEKQEQGR